MFAIGHQVKQRHGCGRHFRLLHLAENQPCGQEPEDDSEAEPSLHRNWLTFSRYRVYRIETPMINTPTAVNVMARSRKLMCLKSKMKIFPMTSSRSPIAASR